MVIVLLEIHSIARRWNAVRFNVMDGLDVERLLDFGIGRNQEMEQD